MLSVKSFTFNPFQENTYIVFDDETLDAAIIDPGCSNSSEESALSEFISRRNLKVKYLLNTHCHIDHVLGNTFCKNTYQVPLHIHSEELPILAAVEAYAATFGITNYQPATADHFLTEGQTITIGNAHLKVLFTPGHAPGHISFYEEKEGIIIVGDTLFFESIGRTDLPGGNFNTLENTIRTKLYTLPSAVIVYPGHGPKTSIGYEKLNNPFVNAQ
jgi:glyoxylase-like metal-dependent hydrolase (beta-lactamase superfamily II)